MHILSAKYIQTFAHAFGDWSTSFLSGWKYAVLKHAIKQHQHIAPTKSKNATDIALVIMAIELIDEADTFAIMTHDSDFTPLVMHLRYKGKELLGLVRNRVQASDAFCLACNVTYELDKASAWAVPTANPTTSHQPKTDPHLNVIAKYMQDDNYNYPVPLALAATLTNKSEKALRDFEGLLCLQKLGTNIWYCCPKNISPRAWLPWKVESKARAKLIHLARTDGNVLSFSRVVQYLRDAGICHKEQGYDKSYHMLADIDGICFERTHPIKKVCIDIKAI